ncbi:MAG: MarR family transcriptional regulator [Dehalococcoidales bacterium]|nr:MarR family transcriptional regulator [Dehalococcoidales bacterium]
MDKKNKEKPVSNDPDYQLWVNLDHLRYMVFKARKQELAQYDITPEQALILCVLNDNNNSLTMNKMVEYTQHQHHSISTLINRMEKKGLVLKEKFAKGRKLNIVITEKGQELIQMMERESFNRIFACLSDNEKKEMQAYLCRLIVSSYKALGQECRFFPSYVMQKIEASNQK